MKKSPLLPFEDFTSSVQKEDGTLNDRKRDGGTNSTLRTKERGTHLTLDEHDDDGDEKSVHFVGF